MVTRIYLNNENKVFSDYDCHHLDIKFKSSTEGEMSLPRRHMPSFCLDLDQASAPFTLSNKSHNKILLFIIYIVVNYRDLPVTVKCVISH